MIKKIATVLLLALTTISYGQKIGLKVGDKAPEISMKSPEGKEIALSSLQGKMVLIDFWASWCGPCRHENPAVVQAYQKFKDKSFKSGKGFTVYGVSLDKNAKNWAAAIKTDKLEWPNHVSDLAGWQNKAASVYRVNSIPANYLIDANGIIVAKNLRGEALINKLNSFVVGNE